MGVCMQLNDCVIGIEFGSTRIKAVLIDERGAVLASGSNTWENRFENGVWTYSTDAIIGGMQSCYAELKKNVQEKFGEKITKVGAIGVSAMMHGYLVFDRDENLLTPFRTWRNNNAEKAAIELTEILDYPIPARWSVAHLYQAVLNKEEHVKDIAFQTTLAGWIHYLLTGEKVVGIDEASGMFPIDPKTKDFDKERIKLLDKLLKDKEGISVSLNDIFPKVLTAGKNAGYLTEKGAKLLDKDGELQAGIVFCPPEGDAATGMVATNAVKIGTGNVSAGTSIFGMVVLDKPLEKVHSEIDLVATPVGDLAAMVHCNNCTSDINAWAGVFSEFAERLGVKLSQKELYELIYKTSLEGEGDCGEVIAYNYVSGENVTNVAAGRPIVVRKTESNFNLPNFLRSNIYSTMATLKLGLDILTKEENVKIDSIVGHGGLFKTENVAQQYLANAVGSPVTVMETAGEGGAWGMAILALYLKSGKDLSLSDYLDKVIFKDMRGKTLAPDGDAVGMEKYMDSYKKGLDIVRKAVEVL